MPNHYGSLTAAKTLTDRALRFVEENKNRPFFLYLSHWDVHVPFNATKEELKKWKQKRVALPADEAENLHPVYAAMIDRVDQSVLWRQHHVGRAEQGVGASGEDADVAAVPLAVSGSMAKSTSAPLDFPI